MEVIKVEKQEVKGINLTAVSTQIMTDGFGNAGISSDIKEVVEAFTDSEFESALMENLAGICPSGEFLVDEEGLLVDVDFVEAAKTLAACVEWEE